MVLEEKFVAYVDILGFTSLVEASEAGKGMSLEARGIPPFASFMPPSGGARCFNSNDQSLLAP